MGQLLPKIRKVSGLLLKAQRANENHSAAGKNEKPQPKRRPQAAREL